MVTNNQVLAAYIKIEEDEKALQVSKEVYNELRKNFIKENGIKGFSELLQEIKNGNERYFE